MYLVLARVHRPTTDPMIRVADLNLTLVAAFDTVEAARAHKERLGNPPYLDNCRYYDRTIIEVPEVYDP